MNKVIKNKRGLELVTSPSLTKILSQEQFPIDNFVKYKIKTNLNKNILVMLKIFMFCLNLLNLMIIRQYLVALMPQAF